MRTLAIGDIHGGYKALREVLIASSFDKENDQLIVLGDVADGWSQVPECVDELLTIKNLIYIIGNHDIWLMNYYKFGQDPDVWLNQGGQATFDAYYYSNNLAEHYSRFWSKGHYYYIDENNNAFVHGGFTTRTGLQDESSVNCVWDRTLFEKANFKEYGLLKLYNKIFIGHTSDAKGPIIRNNVINLDTGGGCEGKLTIMDIDTMEYWQSSLLVDLYPEETKRNNYAKRFKDKDWYKRHFTY